MKTRTHSIASIVTLCLITIPAAYAAPMMGVLFSTQAMFIGKPKTIKFSLRSDLKIPIELKIGDDVVTLEPNTVRNVNLPIGTRVTMNTPTESIQAGALIVEVSDYYSDAVITIKP